MIRMLLGYGGIEGLSKGLNIILSLALATVLSVADYGMIATFIAVELVFTEIILLGQNTFILRYFRIFNIVKFEKNYIASGYIILAATTLLLFGSTLFPARYFLSVHIPEITISILVLILGIYFQANVSLYLMYLRSIENIKYYGILRLSGQAIKFSTAVFFTWYYNDPIYYPIGLVVSGIIIYVIILNRRTEYWKPTLFIRRKGERYIFSENLKFGIPIAIHGVAGASYSVVDRVLLANLADLDAVAVYNFALIQGTSAFFFINILALTMMPKFYSTDNLEKISRQYLNKFLIYSILGVTLLSILVYCVIFPISLNFVRDSYENGRNILPIIGLAMIANCASNYAVYKVTVMNKVNALPIITVLSLGVNATLGYILIPHFGIIGAAYALLITETIYAMILNAFAEVRVRTS